MANRFIDLADFSGGESDDKYKGPKNSFFQAENVEIRKNLAGFQLSPLLTDTGWVFDDDISYMVDLDSIGVKGGGIVVCLENGKVYLDGVLKQTISTGTSAHNEIIGMGYNRDGLGTERIYYITKTSFGQGKIHRSTTDLATWNISYRSFETSSLSSPKCTVLSSGGVIYIFINDRIFYMENIEVVQEYCAIASTEEIIFAFEYGKFYRIYANRGSVGIEYTWDGFSEAPLTREEFHGRPFLGGTNEGAYAYMIVGFNFNYASLVRFPGNQELRINLETSDDSRIFDGYVSIRDTIVHISGGKSGQSTNYGIYTYGNYYPGTQKSLVQSYSKTTSAFTWHAHSDIYSYFACKDNKVYKIHHNNPPTAYALEGYIDSRMEQGSVWEDLNSEDIMAGFELNGGDIEIYARTSFSSSFVLLKNITSAFYGTKRKCRVDMSEIVSNAVAEFGDFTQIQFRIKLIRGATANTTPVFFRNTAKYHVNENNG